MRDRHLKRDLAQREKEFPPGTPVLFWGTNASDRPSVRDAKRGHQGVPQTEGTVHRWLIGQGRILCQVYDAEGTLHSISRNYLKLHPKVADTVQKDVHDVIDDVGEERIVRKF